MMRKIKDLMLVDTMPKELNIAIKRLEAGEDSENIGEDMGDVFGNFCGSPESKDRGGGTGARGYPEDSRLYEC